MPNEKNGIKLLTSIIIVLSCIVLMPGCIESQKESYRIFDNYPIEEWELSTSTAYIMDYDNKITHLIGNEIGIKLTLDESVNVASYNYLQFKFVDVAAADDAPNMNTIDVSITLGDSEGNTTTVETVAYKYGPDDRNVYKINLDNSYGNVNLDAWNSIEINTPKSSYGPPMSFGIKNMRFTV